MKSIAIVIGGILLISLVVWKFFLHGVNENVTKDIASGAKVVLLFSAKWCDTCEKEKPLYEAVKKEFPEVHFYDVSENMNRVEQKLIFKKYAIHGIPTFILFRNAKEFNRFSGLKTKAELREKFSQL